MHNQFYSEQEMDLYRDYNANSTHPMNQVYTQLGSNPRQSNMHNSQAASSNMVKSNPSYQSNPNHGVKKFGSSIEDNGELERNMKKEYYCI